MKPTTLTVLRPLASFAAFLFLGALSGCNVVQPAQDDPTRYFVLTDPAAQAIPAVITSGAPRVGLRAVRLESYLKHREMVVRTGANEVQFKDYRRWAEPLDAAVGRVLRTSLLASSGVAQVLTEPFPFDQQRDYDISIDVRRCEGVLEGSRYRAEFSAAV
ncbi:MAG TPA: ABC-type transport auxiliary lipoprotein family protein [Opitutaceae bacterium]